MRVIPAAIAAAALLTGCANIDPISEDDSQQSAGIETTSVELGCAQVDRTTGREAAAESLTVECPTGDGVARVTWSGDDLRGVPSHKARAGVAIAQSGDLAATAPEGLSVLRTLVETLGPGS